MSLKKLTVSILTAAFLIFGSGAQAALTLTGVSCTGTGMTGFDDCSGAWSGNNANQEADVLSQIFSDWGLTVGAPIDVTGGNTGSSGVLNFANMTGPFVLSLKAGDAFSLYLFDGGVSGISSINYDTLGVGFFSGPNNNLHVGQGLSHADIYAPVPEPETYAMMLIGLGLIGFSLRNKNR